MRYRSPHSILTLMPSGLPIRSLSRASSSPRRPAISTPTSDSAGREPAPPELFQFPNGTQRGQRLAAEPSSQGAGPIVGIRKRLIDIRLKEGDRGENTTRH